jgi:hypothetical protein
MFTKCFCLVTGSMMDVVLTDLKTDLKKAMDRRQSDHLMQQLVSNYLLSKGSMMVERKALKKLHWLDYSMEQLTVWK